MNHLLTPAIDLIGELEDVARLARTRDLEL
jgi:hypothetical protein